MKKIKVTCRYGVTYKTLVEDYGSKGTLYRTISMLGKCCCWVCFNHNCQHPRNEILEGCGENCRLFGARQLFCKKDIQTNDGQSAETRQDKTL